MGVFRSMATSRAFDDSFQYGLTAGISEALKQQIAYMDTMSIVQDIEQFSQLLASMREAREGRLVTLESVFADLL